MSVTGRRAWLLQATAMLAAGTTRPLQGRMDASGRRPYQDAPRLTVRDDGEGGFEIAEQGTPVLRYRYATVPRPATATVGLTESQTDSLRKYGHPRSNYIHPLYGPDGVSLTDDWSKDHPHHRGIYWAWPEVGYKGELGDLHALVRVFARPTGKVRSSSGNATASIDAENEWRWEDATPIVREQARIVVHPRGPHGRVVDLQFTIGALVEGVTLARRQQKLYGGLNTRLAPVAGLALAHHADPPEASPRMAWQTASGTWKGSTSPSSLTIFERADNPHYPGEYVQYPELPWFQPAFPAAGVRHALTPGTPLVLRYRLWMRGGPPPSDEEYRAQWRAFQDQR